MRVRCAASGSGRTRPRRAVGRLPPPGALALAAVALALAGAGCGDGRPERVTVLEVGDARVKEDPFNGKVPDSLEASARGATAHFEGTVAGRRYDFDAAPVALGARAQSQGARILTVRLRVVNRSTRTLRLGTLSVSLDVRSSSEDPDRRDAGIAVATLDCDGAPRGSAVLPTGRSATQCANYVVWKDADPVRLRFRPTSVATTGSWSIRGG